MNTDLIFKDDEYSMNMKVAIELEFDDHKQEILSLMKEGKHYEAADKLEDLMEDYPLDYYPVIDEIYESELFKSMSNVYPRFYDLDEKWKDMSWVAMCAYYGI